MPQLQNYKVSVPLTNFSLGYQNAAFIGEQIFPVMNRSSRWGTYWVYGREVFSAENDLRSPGTRAQEVEHTFSSAQYTAEEHALIEPVTWEERDEAQRNNFPSDPYQDATDVVTQKIALKRELDIATLLRSTSNITQTVTLSAGTTQWNNQSVASPTSFPYTDMMTGHDTIRAQIGRRGNFAIIPYAVKQKLKIHPQLTSMVGANEPKRLSEGQLADIFEVQRIYTPEGIYNTANPGQTISMADIWGKDVILGYTTPTPRNKEITLGAIFRVNYGRFAAQVRTWTEQDRKADFVEASFTEARVLVAPQAGYLIKAAIA